MKNQRSLAEKAVAFVAHIIVLAGLLHMIMSEIMVPYFPLWELYYLVPNMVLALLYWNRSVFVRGHLLQAFSLHLSGMLIGFVPYLIRFLSAVGVLGEKWYLVGPGYGHVTAIWSLMVMSFILLGLFFFNFTIDAAVTGATGRAYVYPFFGKFADRMMPQRD